MYDGRTLYKHNYDEMKNAADKCYSRMFYYKKPYKYSSEDVITGDNEVDHDKIYEKFPWPMSPKECNTKKTGFFMDSLPTDFRNKKSFFNNEEEIMVRYRSDRDSFQKEQARKSTDGLAKATENQADATQNLADETKNTNDMLYTPPTPKPPASPASKPPASKPPASNHQHQTTTCTTSINTTTINTTSINTTSINTTSICTTTSINTTTSITTPASTQAASKPPASPASTPAKKDDDEDDDGGDKSLFEKYKIPLGIVAV